MKAQAWLPPTLLCVALFSLPALAEPPSPHDGHGQHVTAMGQAETGGVTWTSAPLLLPAKANGDRRSSLRLQPVNLTSAQVTVFPPYTGETPPSSWQVPVGAEGAAVNTKKDGNYHLITANGQPAATDQRIASTVYYFANPGPAPRSMLKQPKATLEIRPVDLPREHSQYRANETWAFQAMYQQQPLANIPVVLETSNGTHQTYTSAADGVVQVRFPDDFTSEKPSTGENKPHHGGEQNAQFALSVQHAAMTSAFNYSYSPDAFNQKSIPLAVGLTLGGMLLASPLVFLRRRKSK